MKKCRLRSELGESISGADARPKLQQHHRRKADGNLSGLWMPMIETADIVATATMYRVKHKMNMLCKASSMAAAQDANLFADEIVPMETKMKQVNKETGEETIVDYVVDRDECNRPQTTLEGLNGLAPVRVTAIS